MAELLYFIYLGFLLRELRDFWRVALLISIILHPIDISDTEDEYSQLGKRRDLFNAVENSIIKLGETFEEVKFCSIIWKFTAAFTCSVSLIMSTTQF